MKRNLIASLLFVCVVILFAASCGRQHSSETSSDATNKGPSPPVEMKREITKKGPSPPFEIKDPIISMVMASSIDDNGKLLNPRFSFPQTEKEITAIVQLGNIKGSQLTVTWFKTSDEGDTKLFEHQIQVKSHERAFSVAKNAGMFFSAGTYKVVATLDGQTKEMEFDIIPPKAEPKKTTNNRAARLFAGQIKLTDNRGVSIGTNSDGLLQRVSYEPVSDQSEVRKVASNQSRQSGASQSADAGAEGEAPVSGPSGALPNTQQSTETLFILCDSEGHRCDQDSVADTVGVRSFVIHHGGGEVNVYEAQGDTPIGSYRFANVGIVVFEVDPCWYGGSDLPGTKLSFKAVLVSSADVAPRNLTISLGDDTLAPRVHVVSTPARGSKVKTGDKINLKVDASELRSGGPWQTGVKMIQVTALPGGQWDEPWVNSASPLSQTCGGKTWEQKYEPKPYVVPANPPPIIRLCALAEDYVGNPASNCGEFVTGDWYGTLREHAQGSIYNDTVYVDFSFNEERDGTIKGTGRVNKMTTEPQPWNTCTCTREINLTPDEAEFPISGKRVGDEFQLDLPTGRRLTMNINCDCPPPRRSGSSEGQRSLGLSETFYHPKVKAKDGATNEFHKPGALKVDGWIEIHRAKQ